MITASTGVLEYTVDFQPSSFLNFDSVAIRYVARLSCYPSSGATSSVSAVEHSGLMLQGLTPCKLSP